VYGEQSHVLFGELRCNFKAQTEWIPVPMDAIAFVMFLAWVFAAAVWLLTFVRPFRTAFARGFLAPRKLPLRSARWRLGVAAMSAFALFMVIIVNEPNSKDEHAAATTTPTPPVAAAAKPQGPRLMGGFTCTSKAAWDQLDQFDWKSKPNGPLPSIPSRK